MEDTLLRVFVVVVGLLFPKEHTVLLEHDDDIIMGMQKREDLLQREKAKLEQELHTVREEPAHINQEVPQSYQKLPNGNQEVLHQKLPKGDQEVVQLDKTLHLIDKETSNGEQWLPHVDPKASEVDETFSRVDQELSEMTERSQGEKEVLESNPVVSKMDQEVSQVGQMRSQKDQEVSQVDERSQEKQEVSQVNELSQEYQEVPQIDEKIDPKQSQADEEAPDIDQKQGEHVISRQTEDSYMWYLWNAYSLISIIRVLKRFLKRGSQNPQTSDPTKTERDLSAAHIVVSAKVLLPDNEVLVSFCDSYVRGPPRESWRAREFVEGFVDDLLEAMRSTRDQQDAVEIEDRVSVGSLCESWSTGNTQVCDLLVPITPPGQYSFQVHLWCEQSVDALSDMQGCGRIKMEKSEDDANGCPCGSANLDDDDVLCLLHTHNNKEKDVVVTDPVNGPLCSENTPYLSKARVVTWFRAAIAKAWCQISHKYEFELTFRNHVAPGALKVRFRSGKAILFNVTPVVKLKDSDAYLTSHFTSSRGDSNLPDTHWPLSFAAYEQNLLQHFSKRMPANACHLRCLQILSFLHRKQTDLTGKSALTHQHLETVLLHLLLAKRPCAWQPEHLAARLREALGFLEKSLRERRLHHALIGNALVPEEIGIPAVFCESGPMNVFQALVLQRGLYIKTVQHFQEMLRNTPVLIKEYASDGCKKL